MAIDSTYLAADPDVADVPDERGRWRWRRWLPVLLTLALVIASLAVLGSLIDPSAGAAGGCGGG